MKRLNDQELNRKIEGFMSRKLAQHPDLQQPDGIRAGKRSHMDAGLKYVWHLFDGPYGRPAGQH